MAWLQFPAIYDKTRQVHLFRDSTLQN